LLSPKKEFVFVKFTKVVPLAFNEINAFQRYNYRIKLAKY